MLRSLPLISIIIPVYNVELYLKECIDSVLNQTYRNLEIILVDDGSKDDSGRICDAYQFLDSRVVVIHQQNQGVAQARNKGIAMAHGKYVMFVDSDDWIDDVMCASLVEALSEHNAQSAMCSYIREYPEKSLVKVIVPNNKVFDGKTLLRRLCGPVAEELRHPENLECFNMMCGKIYPREALNGVTVTDLKKIGSSEDLLFNLECFLKIESMVYINRPFYHYRKSVGASVTAAYKPDLERQWSNLYDIISKVIESNQLDDGCWSALNNRIALNVLGLGLNCMQADTGLLGKCNKMKSIVTHPRRSEALKQLPIKNMPLHWKIFFWAAKHKLAYLLCIMLTIIKKLRGKV